VGWTLRIAYKIEKNTLLDCDLENIGDAIMKENPPAFFWRPIVLITSQILFYYPIEERTLRFSPLVRR
jgi:hypothetical protein